MVYDFTVLSVSDFTVLFVYELLSTFVMSGCDCFAFGQCCSGANNILLIEFSSIISAVEKRVPLITITAVNNE